MKTLNQSKIVFMAILITSIFSHAKGGSSAGGGGSNVVDTQTTHPIGLIGALLQQSKGLRVDEKVKNLVSEKKLVTQTCPNGSPILTMPEQLKDKIQLCVEPSRSFIGKLFSDNTPLKANAPSIESVCQNEDTYNAYNSVVLGLIEIADRKEYDGAANYLISKTVELGGPIQIITSPRQIALPAVGGELEEAAWYDQKTDTIYFNQLKPCEGFKCWAAREESSILIHEIGHSFLKRVYKDRYPEVDQWHDIRHLGKQDVDYGLSPLAHSQTSQQAAFIEALANSFEARHYLVDHPFMNNKMLGDFMYMVENGCYYPKVSIYKKMFSQIPFKAPEDNEVYLSSALYAMQANHRINEKAVNSGVLRTNESFIIKSSSSARQKALIDAIATTKPANVSELAAAFDQQSQSDYGWRMLRQFFFTDYKTGEKLGTLYSAGPDVDGIKFGPEPEFKVCGPIADYEKSLSYSYKNERKQVENKANAQHASNVTKNALIEDINSSMKKAVETLDQLTQKVFDFDRADEVQIRLSQNPRICVNDFVDSKTVDSIYRRLEKDGQIVPLQDIASIIQKNCKNIEYKNLDLSDIKENLTQYVSLMNESVKIIFQTKQDITTVGSDEYGQLVQKWLETKGQLQIRLRNISSIALVVRATEQLGL